MAACLGSMMNQNQHIRPNPMNNNLPNMTSQPVMTHYPLNNPVSNNYFTIFNFHQLINFGHNKLNNKRVKKIIPNKRRNNNVNSTSILNTTPNPNSAYKAE